MPSGRTEPSRSRPYRRQSTAEAVRTVVERALWRYRVALRTVEFSDIDAEPLTAEEAHQRRVVRSWLRHYASMR
jgi:hypothetical protein